MRVEPEPRRPLFMLCCVTSMLGLIATSSNSAADNLPIQLVQLGAEWRYFDQGDPGAGWQEPEFDDSTWPSGPAQLGFGDNDETTLINRINDGGTPNASVAFRARFNLDCAPPPEAILAFNILRDDGAVIYINGNEVSRSNMPLTGPIAYDTRALGAVGGVAEDTFFQLLGTAEHLVLGENVIAVSVHQSSLGSSDLSFDLNMTLGEANTRPQLAFAQKLKPSEAFSSTPGAGSACAIVGDTIFVGADNADGGRGSMYIYERSTLDPNQYLEIKAVRGSAVDDRFANFGRTIAASGDTVAVGAFQDRVPRPDGGDYSDAGTVYVFERDAGGEDNWGETAELYPDDPTESRFFGIDLDLEGDTLVIGAGGYSAQTANAYVFQRDASDPRGWRQIKRLEVDSTRSLEGFGRAVAISGDTIVVGAGQIDTLNQPPGSAYVFERNAGGQDNWGQVKTLLAPIGPSDNRFGAEVDIEDDTIVVCSFRATPALNPPGAAYVFSRDTGGADNWGTSGTLRPENGDAGLGYFGENIDIDRNRVIIGLWNAEKTYVFHRNTEGLWSRVQTLVPPDLGVTPQKGLRFGRGVASSDGRVIIGAPRDDSGGINRFGGAAYLYNVSGLAPAIGMHPTSMVRQVGEQAELSVTAAGDGSLSYRWLRDGVPIPNSNRPALTLDTGAPDPIATYAVEVSNATGSTLSQPAYVRIVSALQGTPAIAVERNGRGGRGGEGRGFGYAFQLDDDQTVTHLGTLDTDLDGIEVTIIVGLWDRSTGELLREVTVEGPNTDHPLVGNYRQIPVEPIDLIGGRQYVISFFSGHTVDFVTSPGEETVSDGVEIIATLISQTGQPEMPAEPTTSTPARVQPNFLMAEPRPARPVVLDGVSKASPEVPRDGRGFVDFANTPVTRPLDRAFTISNVGETSLFLGALSLPEGFELTTEFPEEIPAGGSVPLGIRLSAITPGSYSGTVQFATSAAHPTPFAFPIRGVVDPNSPPEIAPSPPLLLAEDFDTHRIDLAPIVSDVQDPLPDLQFDVQIVADPASTLESAQIVHEEKGRFVELKSAADAFGNAEITLSVVDQGGLDASATIAIEVSPVQDAPRRVGTPTEVVADAAGSPAGLQLAPFFTDPDPGDVLSFAIADAGDGSILSSASIDAESGLLSVEFLPYVSGDQEVRVRATDLEGDSIEQTVQVMLPALPLPEVTIVGTPTLNRQTGLFEQTLTVTNNAGRAIGGFGLEFAALEDGVELYNRSLIGPSSSPGILFDHPVAPGDTLQVTLEFYSSARGAPASPTLEVTSLSLPGDGIEPGASIVSIDRILPLPDGAMLLEFKSEPGTSYQLQYLAPGGDWHDLPHPIRAAGTRVQWIDRGPPATPTPPGDSPSRLYRVIGATPAITPPPTR